MKKNTNYIWKLGMFVIIGLVLLIITIYFIGQNKNLFGSTFELNTKFKNVSGLNIGNNVRFSGINIGSIKEIEFISDSCVVVKLVIKEDVKQFIKTDAIASIGSDGLMGDKVLTISPGTASNKIVQDNATITSIEAVEMEDLMKSVKASLDNAKIITGQLAQFSHKINNNEGLLSKVLTDATFADKLDNTMTNLELSSEEFSDFTKKLNNNKNVLSKLVNDEKLGKSVDSTVLNIQNATKGIDEVTEAAKNNFLLKGYFNKKKKAEAKKQKELKKAADKKAKALSTIK